MLGSLQNAQYSAGSQILSLTQANAGKISYTYYDNGLLKTQTDANGNTSTLTYDEAGRLSTVTDGAGAVTTLSYDNDGNLSLIENALGSKTQLKYNEYRKVAEATDNNGNVTRYEYDSSLNCIKVTDAEGGVTKFSYDARNRITSVTKKGKTKAEDITLSMTYDNFDNVTSITDGELDFATVYYAKMTDFVYDFRNRLVQAGDTSYTYDAENNRIGVETGEKRTTYVINTQPELSQVLQSTEIKLTSKDANSEIDKGITTSITDNANTTTTCYFYGNGLASQDNGKDYFSYHFNNVGSTMAVTDARGSVVETYNYTPYGELIDGEYREDIPFLYNGQYGVTTDSNGLYYMRARYYNVEIKRFINQDVLIGVLERVSSLNRYAYVEGNPVSYLDPFGLAIQVLQNILDAAGVIVSFLSLVAIFAPVVASSFFIAFNIFYASVNFVLNSVQLIRYQNGERADELVYDLLLDSIGVLSPVFTDTGLKVVSKIGKLLGSNGTTFIKFIYDLKSFVSSVYS